MLNPSFTVLFRRRIYEYRFLITFIIIGILSLLVEILVFRGLGHLAVSSYIALPCGFMMGVFFAYWLNVRLNFKVPKSKRVKSFYYFCGISLVSAGLNFKFSSHLLTAGYDYEVSRFASSGVLFIFAYLLHRRFSFADRKQVGVAVYANGVEDIAGIFQKVQHYPDFIHVDIVDHTFGEEDLDPRAYRLEAIRAYWPRLAIHVHLMTKRPLFWIDAVLPFADVVIPHLEIKENLTEVFMRIKNAKKSVGLSLLLDTPLKEAAPYLANCEILQFLAIPNPGKSGQKMALTVLEKINEVSKYPLHSSLRICVDGGINETTVKMLDVEMVVSGSSVLQNADPIDQIMRLQTSSDYNDL